MLLATEPVDALSCSPEMAWTTPHYSRAEVDEAGQVLIRDDEDVVVGPADLTPEETADLGWRKWHERNEAIEVINNWRSSHSYPLNAFTVVLRTRARAVNRRAVVSQRIKRLPAIEFKLREFRRRRKVLALSDMQDIGGCRAVLPSVQEVRKLVTLYQAGRRSAQQLDYPNDYITKPKHTGYRSFHLIYRYRGRKKAHHGMRIEIQLRSNLQHIWATAVETAGTFQRQALKSSRGDKRWRRFFSLMGTQMAMREGTPPVPNTPDGSELKDQLRSLATELQVESRLTAYGTAMRETETLAKDSRYYLLELMPGAEGVGSTLTITGFKAKEREAATQAYQKAEQGKAGADIVLVSVESLDALKRAYPSYFLDTRQFVDAVKEAIQ
jgi:hypothetical protein